MPNAQIRTGFDARWLTGIVCVVLVGFGAAIDVPQLEQNTASSGICVPHFWQNIVMLFSYLMVSGSQASPEDDGNNPDKAADRATRSEDSSQERKRDAQETQDDAEKSGTLRDVALDFGRIGFHSIELVELLRCFQGLCSATSSRCHGRSVKVPNKIATVAPLSLNQ